MWRDGVRLNVRVTLCRHFLARARGLLWRRPLRNDEVVLLAPCRAVHTFGLGYPIDVIYTDERGCVIECRRELLPRRISRCRRAYAVWEMRAGTADRLGIHTGSRLHCRGNASVEFMLAGILVLLPLLLACLELAQWGAVRSFLQLAAFEGARAASAADGDRRESREAVLRTLRGIPQVAARIEAVPEALQIDAQPLRRPNAAGQKISLQYCGMPLFIAWSTVIRPPGAEPRDAFARQCKTNNGVVLRAESEIWRLRPSL